MSSVSGKSFDLKLFRRVFQYVKPHRKVFYWCCFFTISSALVAPIRPFLVQVSLDKYIAHSDLDGLYTIMTLLVGVLIIHGLIEYAETFLTNLLGQNVVCDLRVSLFKKILSFRSSYFDKTPIGTLQTRVISDMETVGDIFSEGLIVILGDLLQLVVVIIVMLYTDWKLTLISLSTIPFLLIATKIFQEGIKSTFQEVRTQVAALNTFVQEHLTGMSVVQLFNREEEEYKKFKQINELHANAHIRSVWYYSVFFPVVELVSALSIGLLVWWGIKGVTSDETSFGSIVAFMLYLNMVFRPVRELADKFNTLQMGMVSSERIFKILDTDESISNAGKIFPAELKGDIQFENVWFSYTGKENEWALKNISFHLKPGQMIAVVGATGSGKSTLTNLLSRFYEFEKGEIKVDGMDIRKYELNTYRSNISVVLQDVFLFSGSIRDNITLYNPKYTDEDVNKALKSIGADSFVEKLPGGIHYDVQERGATLSTGQRQLLSFARAYIYNPSLLILDEATSSIDTENEILVKQASEKLTQGRTSVVIAHRLSTVQKADCILVMDKGEIIESGTHRELLAAGGLYRKLYETQIAE